MGFYTAADFQPDISIGYLSKRVSHLTQLGLQPVFAREGLSNIHWHALIAIHFGRGATCVALARDLSYDKGATTRLIDQLEARGWVKRSREHGDRRLVALRLTPEGEQLAERVRLCVIDEWNAWLEGWSEEDVSQAIAMLQRLRETLEGRVA